MTLYHFIKLEQHKFMANIFFTETNAIAVSVQPQYLDGESSPVDAQYMWAYHVKIKNNSKDVIQLLNRFWRITDGYGVVQEVRGAGVIGLQPVIMPSEEFEYSSSVMLPTPTGIMHGTYQMRKLDDKYIDIAIPVFSLDSDDAIRLAN